MRLLPTFATRHNNPRRNCNKQLANGIPLGPEDSGTPLDRLQDAGGWASPAMPLRYVETAKIANQGVLLGERG